MNQMSYLQSWYPLCHDIQVICLMMKGVSVTNMIFVMMLTTEASGSAHSNS